MNSLKNQLGNLVYSTEHSNKCPKCKKKLSKCKCAKNKPAQKQDGIVRIKRETKGRKGKGVSIVTGVPLTAAELKKLAKTLKKKCGSGGTIKNDDIEIQGDHREILKQELEKQGYQVKLAGG